MSEQWFVFKDQQQKGPFTWEQLWQQARSGNVGPADHFWTEGMSDWTRGDRLESLFPKPVAAPSPAPPPRPPAASPPPPRQPVQPAAPPPVSAAPAASPYQQQGGGAPGPFSDAPSKKKGRGCLIVFLILILILGLLAAGVYYVYKFHLPDWENIAEILPLPVKEEDSLIGAWFGKDEFDEEGYLKFNADGTMHLATPAGGFWTTAEYRIQEEGEISNLEIYDPALESWERRFTIVQVGKETLTVTDGEITLEMSRISDQQFQNVIDNLIFEKIY